ncbi:hypothetical protein Ddye_009822 [Dipteronia dyeriana]|uniref:Reverse transcriptase n=1 Tax=Dipteronia dyeriana TaxID=168575 RepID=A0AAE0CMK1_9ROSI|nr:hypothetical protein Ddye_009822 [Dipteronia dyeriana]
MGGVSRRDSLMDNFRVALEECGLKDLGFVGSPFTWSNRRAPPNLIEERLDRCVGNMEWREIFRDVTVTHLPFWRSDHIPILLNIAEIGGRQWEGKRPFHYQRSWVEKEGCLESIQAAWKASNGCNIMTRMVNNLGSCARQLQQWNKDNRRRLNENILLKKKELFCLSGTSGLVVWNRCRVVERELDNLLNDEETLWRQHSRVGWMKKGDPNT